MLDLPDVVDAEPVGELDLVERLLVKPQLRILGPGLRQLMLVEKSEFHRWCSARRERGWDEGPPQAIHRKIAAAASSGLSSSAR